METQTVSYISKEDLQQIIGKNIRKNTNPKKINLMKLSEQVDMSYEYLRSIVSPKGKKQLSFYSIYKFSVALDTSLDELIKE